MYIYNIYVYIDINVYKCIYIYVNIYIYIIKCYEPKHKDVRCLWDFHNKWLFLPWWMAEMIAVSTEESHRDKPRPLPRHV